MKTTLHLTATTLGLLSVVSVQAQFSYVVTNGAIAITKYTGSGGDVTVPDTIKNLPVTSIGASAFYDCASLTNVVIGRSITNIGDSAFFFCSSLAAITVDPRNIIYSSLDGVLLDKSQATLVVCPAGRIGSYAIPDSVTNVQSAAFYWCRNLTDVTMGSNVTGIGDFAFSSCTSLTGVTLGTAITKIPRGAFLSCTSLTSLTIPTNVSSIADRAFSGCSSLTSVFIGNGVTNIDDDAFSYCTNLTEVTLGTSLASIGDYAFSYCKSLIGIHFQGNAPNLGGPSVFLGGKLATIYYLSGTSGWGSRFGGLPTAFWVQELKLTFPPQTQTAEVGSAVGFWVRASSPLPLFYRWYFNSTNLLSSSTSCALQLTNVQSTHSGAYIVTISNALGAVTSAPAILNVISAVERRAVPALKVAGETARLLTVEYANSILPATPNWAPLVSVSLTSTPTRYFDLTLPPFQQRFYRVWQKGNSDVPPSLALSSVPAITLRGNIGQSVRLDYINRFGSIDAWVKLDTVVLTNASQLYFDISSPGQPQRLYRVVQEGRQQFMAFGSAIIDGRISPGEWDKAAYADITVNLPEGGTTPGRVLVMNDRTNLYLAVWFIRPSRDTGNSASFELDKDNSGTISDGDDVLLMNPEIGFFDGCRTTNSPCPPGSLCGVYDTELGGQNDGEGSFSNDGAHTIYEFSHPLSSPDGTHDVQLKVGQSIGFSLFLRVLSSDRLADTDLYSLGTIAVAPYPDCFPNLPNPQLKLERVHTMVANGQSYDYYELDVENYSAFPDILFAEAPDLPPCGLNTSAARTWLQIHNAADGSYLNQFCGFRKAADMNDIWFAVPTGARPPAGVYVVIWDRRCGFRYVSSPLTIR